MRLKLRDIVRNFVNGPQSDLRRAHAQCFLKCLARVVRDHLRFANA